VIRRRTGCVTGHCRRVGAAAPGTAPGSPAGPRALTGNRASSRERCIAARAVNVAGAAVTCRDQAPRSPGSDAATAGGESLSLVGVPAGRWEAPVEADCRSGCTFTSGLPQMFAISQRGPVDVTERHSLRDRGTRARHESRGGCLHPRGAAYAGLGDAAAGARRPRGAWPVRSARRWSGSSRSGTTRPVPVDAVDAGAVTFICE